MKGFISILLVAIGASIAVTLNKELLKRGIEPVSCLLVSSVGAVVFWRTAEVLLIGIPMRVRTFRRLLDPSGKFEGIYVEIFDGFPERPVSIGKIQYNSQSKSYAYAGRALDSAGNLRATWQAFDLETNPGKNRIRYFFEAELVGQKSESIRGYGVLDFNTCTGYFVDSGTDLQKCYHTFRRLERKDFVELTGKAAEPETDEWGKIAVRYLQRNRGQ